MGCARFEAYNPSSLMAVFLSRYGRSVWLARCPAYRPPHPVATHAEDWSRTLSTFEIDLKRDGTLVDHGLGTNVLGGPVSALRHLIDQVNPPLAAGEIVTTGTLTRAFPVSVGETWATELTGVALSGICIRFT